MALPFFGNSEKIEGHSLKCAFTAALGFRPSKVELRHLLGANCSSATRAEFAAAVDCFLESEDKRDELRRLFRLFDNHGRGFVTLDDFAFVCAEVTPSLSSTTIANAFADADTTSTGRLSFQQFESLMLAQA